MQNISERREKSKDIALVLSSGGARGLVHIGAIEELESQGYRISSVAGCSMGALVGGIYAAGKLTELRELMKSVDKWKLLSLADLSLSLNHIVKGDKVVETLRELIADVKIEDWPIPYCAISTDWERGEEVVFREGSLLDAIRASISLPALFNPRQSNGQILIDGGVMNPLPLDRVARKEGDLLVAVDVSGHDYWGQRQMQMRRGNNRKGLFRRPKDNGTGVNYVSLLARASSLMIRRNSLLMEKICPPDILIDIQLDRYDGLDYDKSEKLVAIGHKKTAKVLQEKKCEE